MNWKHAIFFKNVSSSLIELAFNLGCAFRICTFTKWQFFILVMGLRNVPEDWHCWTCHNNCLLNKWDRNCPLILFFLLLLWLNAAITTIFMRYIDLLGILHTPFSCAGYSSWDNFVKCNILIEELYISKVWLSHKKWFNIPIYLLFSVSVVLEALVQGWCYHPVFMLVGTSKRQLVWSLGVYNMKDWWCSQITNDQL